LHHKLICVDCLVGFSEIAERLGVSQTTVDNWIQGIRAKNYRPFPEPVKTIGRSRIWDWSEVLEWYENYRPSHGGAPTGNRNGKRTQLTVRTEKGWRNAG
jgi:predicted DNA-binding transcriptional regulator AlpA